jgi:hypothetical protein
VQLTGSAFPPRYPVSWLWQILTALPVQDVRIGSVELPHVSFFSLAGIQKDARLKGVDGVLATALFRRVFIDHADHFAVLEAR